MKKNSLFSTKYLLFCLLLTTFSGFSQVKWSPITQQNKPWSRWWWMGSSVNKNDLTTNLKIYQKAGLGGLEVTPIYGVKGEEKNFIDFLSPKWMQMLDHTLVQAKKLNMGIDVANASGWPFGGRWVTPEDACKNIVFKTFSLKSGEMLAEKIEFIQKPLVRAEGKKNVDIKDLLYPIDKNPNLQALALDQVRFELPLPLQTLMAYSDKGKILNLTNKIEANGKLNWIAPEGNWTLYALFQGWHGKMVERASPGGEGNVIDHFSEKSLKNYLNHFDKAFAGHHMKQIRAFFNDSYEVDDASGQSNWTPAMFVEFQKRKGYDLRNELLALFGKDIEEKISRIRCDYREVIADLLLEKYTSNWKKWAKGNGVLVRNQAHGSPANILDLYNIVDIPEIEGTELLRTKFASSAANVSGKKLTSSESATWLDEHFLSTLSGVKNTIDQFFLGGVNHIFYHGTAYSPPNEPFPGWLFYAAVEFTPQNPFWKDFGKLNDYVARCQSFLQKGKPHNDVLLYFPIYDRYSDPNGSELLEHFDGIPKKMSESSFKFNAEMMLERGFAFDYISDRQLQKVLVSGQKLQTGGVAYQTILVPECHFMPLKTFQQLLDLAQNGATILFHKSLPTDVPGFSELENRRKNFKNLVAKLHFSADENVQKAYVGKGQIWVGNDAEELLNFAKIYRNTMQDLGLKSIRRSYESGDYFFIKNEKNTIFEGWISLPNLAKSVAIFNPMTTQLGIAETRLSADGKTEIFAQIKPDESLIIQTSDKILTGKKYQFYVPESSPQEISGSWKITFTAGGEKIPASKSIEKLTSWTNFEDENYKNFSGTAKYEINFAKPIIKAEGYFLNLGEVHESAKVWLNGKNLGTLIGPNYEVFVPKNLLKGQNSLEIEVTNLMANRIADLDRRGVRWQKFYNVNVAARLKENRDENGVFTAAKWQPLASGLVGAVTLTPVKIR